MPAVVPARSADLLGDVPPVETRASGKSAEVEIRPLSDYDTALGLTEGGMA